MNSKKVNLTLLILSFGFMLSFFISCDKPTDSGDDPVTTELEGTWIGNEIAIDSITLDTFYLDEYTGKFYGNVTEFHLTENPLLGYKGTFTLDTTKSPKELDALITESLNTQYVGLTTLSIYKLEGTTLLCATNEPGETVRPKYFFQGGEPYTKLFILKKQE